MNFWYFKYTYFNSTDSFMLLTTAGTHLTTIILTLEICPYIWAMCIWNLFIFKIFLKTLSVNARNKVIAVASDSKTKICWNVLGRWIQIYFYRIDYWFVLAEPTVYTARMAGFFLYVSNTTVKEHGYICFHEMQRVNGTPSEDQRINCPVHGRYVIYYNERIRGYVYPSYYSEFAYYELCELEVYGEFTMITKICNNVLFQIL